MGKYKGQSELKRKRKKESSLNFDKFIPEKKKSEVNIISMELNNKSECEKLNNYNLMSLNSESDEAQNDERFVYDENSSDITENEGIIEKLRNWSLNHNINRNAISDLLHILKNDKYPELPLSYKTLLKTPRKTSIIDIAPGKLAYFGLERYLISALENTKELVKILELDINIDGCPIFDNSKEIGTLWPILCKINNLNSEVFPIGVYCGKNKPDDFNELMTPFVEEFLEKEINLIFNGNNVKLNIRSFDLDAPARASVCGIVGHNSFSGCPKCIVEGQRINNRTVFLNHAQPLRTDEDFRQKVHSNHHKTVSILERIENIDMIKAFPIDYLHNILLGVLKKMLDILFGMKGLYAYNTKLIINSLIENAIKHQPSDFHRKIRNIEKFKMWKGTELRSFLMFIGPVVLQSTISKEHYRIFMILHTAFAILKDKKFCRQFNSVASKLMLHFVDEFEICFGPEYITYNFHLATHLSQDCLTFGPLDEFSCFKFESYMGKLKSYVKSPHRPLEQISNRINENFKRNGLKCKGFNSILTLEDKIDDNHYSKLILNQTFVKNNDRDCFVQTICRKIIKVDKFLQTDEGIFMIGHEFTNINSIYSLPIESEDIDEFKVKMSHKIDCIISVNKIYRKFYVVEINHDQALFFPLSPI